MIVRVLGSAAGGGVPQWNCGCANCAATRNGMQPSRTQSSFALSATGERWWLVNVSPDVAQQVEAFDALQPRAVRDTPIRGFLITDANVDHLGGLAVLRQAGTHRFGTYSSETIRSVARSQPAFAPFQNPPHVWHSVTSDEAFALEDDLSVRVVPVAGLTPGYDGRRVLPDAVVAYDVRDGATGGSVLFAPVFAAVDATLRDAVAHSDVALLDGSFWTDEELAELGIPKPAQSLGHLPVGGPGGSLKALGDLSGRTQILYAHLNNTNPLLDPTSDASLELKAANMSIAADGMEFRL